MDKGTHSFNSVRLNFEQKQVTTIEINIYNNNCIVSVDSDAFCWNC